MYRILAGILNIGNIEFAAISSQHQTDKSEVPSAEALENGNYLMSVHCVVKVCVFFIFIVFEDCKIRCSCCWSFYQLWVSSLTSISPGMPCRAPVLLL